MVAGVGRAREVRGSDHPYTLYAAHTLAQVLSVLGEYQAARELGEDTLARRRRIRGDDHSDTQDSEEFLRWLDEQKRNRKPRFF